MTPRSSPSRSIAFVAAAVLLAGCATSAPTPLPSSSLASPSPAASGAPTSGASPTPVDQSTVYRNIEQQVIAIRGLKPKAEVNPTILDDAGLTKIITDGFNKDNPPKYVAAYGRLLTHMGLMKATDDLQKLFIELLSSQVIGLYDSDTKKLYVVSRTGGLGPTQEVTFAHEFTHAMQDQYYDLNKLNPTKLDEGDFGIARTSLAEGDATLLMTIWAQANLTAAQLATIVQEANDPASLAILKKMPALLQETLQFPYSAGLSFVGAQFRTGGWDAVDALYKKPPDTTEQILHFDKYESGEKAVDVTFPADLATRLGSGWKEVLQDTFGEFQESVWLREVGGLAAAAANKSAAGWGGDRVVLLEGPNDAWAVVVDTAWDTKTDASEFVDGADGIATALKASASADVLRHDPKTATVLIASSPQVLGKVANVLGLAG